MKKWKLLSTESLLIDVQAWKYPQPRKCSQYSRKVCSLPFPQSRLTLSSVHIKIDHQPPTERSSLSSDGPPAVDLQKDTSRNEHKPHPNCPNSLDCLSDTDARPQYTIPTLIRCAILGSPNQRLPVRAIYEVLETKFPYFLAAGVSYKVTCM